METESVGKYGYTLVYGEGETKQVRAYNLIEKDNDKGRYSLDENNGIILDVKVIENKIYSLFEVNDILLTTFITFETASMIFEITTTSKNNKQVVYTQGKFKTEVISYPITAIQKAVLKKQ